MRRRTVIRGVMLCAMLPVGAAYGGETMNVHASLTVEAKHEKVLVTFRIENRGERRVGLPRAIATDEELNGRLFDLREHPGGAEVAYVGKMVKRAALGADDYFELPPHSAHTHTIDITRAYAFKPGMHTYEIRYEGAALADVKQLESMTGIRTEPVMFAHTEK
jgi:hypothetical protein